MNNSEWRVNVEITVCVQVDVSAPNREDAEKAAIEAAAEDYGLTDYVYAEAITVESVG